jgi:hypothetical protein
MKFFIDNNLSRHLAQGMSSFGEDVVHLKDQFPEDTEDVKWLKYIGQNRFVLITRDEQIRWKPAEIEALRKYKVDAFFLGGKKLNRCKIIQLLIRHWPRIKEYAQKTKAPYAFRIPPSGTKFRQSQI